MPPRVVRPASGAPPRPRDLRPGFEAQTCETRHPMVLRPKPPNRPASSVPRTRPPPTRVTAVLDRPDAKSPEPPARLARPPSRPGRHGHSTCPCARRCPKCQPLRLATRRSGPSIQASRPPFLGARVLSTTRPRPPFTSTVRRHGTSPRSPFHRSHRYSARQVPTWSSPRRQLPDPQLGTCTTRTKKHVARHTAVCKSP